MCINNVSADGVSDGCPMGLTMGHITGVFHIRFGVWDSLRWYVMITYIYGENPFIVVDSSIRILPAEMTLINKQYTLTVLSVSV